MAGGVAQGVGPEFKFQYHKKKGLEHSTSMPAPHLKTILKNGHDI
jgi:hypothetical protein